jgi:hypothetical protein
MRDCSYKDHRMRGRRPVIAIWVALTLLASPCFVICDGGGDHAAIETIFAGCCSSSLDGPAPAPAGLAGAESDCPDSCTDTPLVGDWVAVRKSKRPAPTPGQQLAPSWKTADSGAFDRGTLHEGVRVAPAGAPPAVVILRL